MRKHFQKIFVSTAGISLVSGVLAFTHADCEALGNSIDSFLAAYETLHKQLEDVSPGSIDVVLDRATLYHLKMGTPDCIEKSLKCLAKYAMVKSTGKKRIEGAENIDQEAKKEISQLVNNHEKNSLEKDKLIQKDIDSQNESLKNRLEKRRQTRAQSKIHSGEHSPNSQNKYQLELEKLSQKLEQLKAQALNNSGDQE